MNETRNDAAEAAPRITYHVAFAVTGKRTPMGNQVFRVISVHRSMSAAEYRAKREAGVPQSGPLPSSPCVFALEYRLRRGEDF